MISKILSCFFGSNFRTFQIRALMLLLWEGTGSLRVPSAGAAKKSCTHLNAAKLHAKDSHVKLSHFKTVLFRV